MAEGPATVLDRLQADVNQAINFAIAAGAAVADFDGQLWTADDDYELVESIERHAVAGAAADIKVLKVPSGTAKSAGTNMLASAGHSAAGVANTNSIIGASATVANRKVARGDSIGIELSGASAGLDGVSVTVFLKPINPKAGQ